MVKYHISKETGRPNICRAEIKDCPLKDDDGQPVPHYTTKEEARKGAEERLERSHGLFNETKKIVKAPRADKDNTSILRDSSINITEKRKVLQEYLSDERNKAFVDKTFEAQGDNFNTSYARSIILGEGNNTIFRQALKNMDDDTTTADFLTDLDQLAFEQRLATKIEGDQLAPRVMDNSATFENNKNILSDDDILFGDPEKIDIDDSDMEDFSDDTFDEYDEDFSDDSEE